MSSSHDGLTATCTAGVVAENMPATNAALSTNSGVISDRAPFTSDTEGEFLKLPQIVDMKTVKQANKTRQGSKTKKMIGPKSKTKQPSNQTVPFGCIRPIDGSPPPPPRESDTAEAGVSATPAVTEEDEGRFSRWSSDLEIFDYEEGPLGTDSSNASIRTNASGAAKRTRRQTERQTKRKTTRTQVISSSRTQVISSSEDDLLVVDSLNREGRKDKRGRPIVTGKGVEIRAIQEKKMELKSLEEEIQVMKKIAEGGYDPASFRGKKRTEMTERLEEESADMPIRALVTDILQSAKKVEEVALKSSNLKGGFIRSLRESALKIEVGIDAISKKALPSENTDAQEVEHLRSEVHRLKEELRRSKEAAIMPPPPPPPSVCGGDEDIVEQPMDVDSTPDPPPPSVILPPREEWPPAVRPAIQGKSRVLTDDEEVIPKRSNPSRSSRCKQTDKDVESIIDMKLTVFAKTMRMQMQEMFASFKEQMISLISSDRALTSAPVESITKSGTTGCSIPEKEKRKVSASRKRDVSTSSKRGGSTSNRRETSLSKKDKLKGQKAVTSDPPSSTSSKPQSSNNKTSGENRSQPAEAQWTQVLGRKAAKQTRQATKAVVPTSVPGTLNKIVSGGKKAGKIIKGDTAYFCVLFKEE
ncbi:uncharacterized protein [Cardiocondyla obscurior]|uniref:uncharacterized protein n=2 Tax=Cardiocondyla obscurior TaxID=286306 RepID=UPI0039657522